MRSSTSLQSSKDAAMREQPSLHANELDLWDLRFPKSVQRTQESVFGIGACNEDASTGESDLAALASCKTLAKRAGAPGHLRPYAGA